MKFKFGIMMLIAMLIVTGCSTEGNNNPVVNNRTENMNEVSVESIENNINEDADKDVDEAIEEVVMDPIQLTLEELKKYNGKNDMPAYVAVDGLIYDVTESKYWKNGGHNGFEAGQDLSREIKEVSPHGIKNLERVKEIGILIEDMATEEMIELTLEELKKYNGKNDMPAYVAVDGVIYDVTESKYWKDGGHNGFEAGQDLTKEIKEVSPHGIKNLERVEEIGLIKEDMSSETSEETKVEVTETKEATETKETTATEETTEEAAEEATETKESTETEEATESETPYSGQLDINESEIGDLRLTLQELKKFDGYNGAKGYIAIDGLIFDVSEVSQWMGGVHNGFEAGQDLTKEMKSISPHGFSKLKYLKVLGKIIE
jgi:predicted heme/steroid binding protein